LLCAVRGCTQSHRVGVRPKPTPPPPHPTAAVSILLCNAASAGYSPPADGSCSTAFSETRVRGCLLSMAAVARSTSVFWRHVRKATGGTVRGYDERRSRNWERARARDPKETPTKRSPARLLLVHMPRHGRMAERIGCNHDHVSPIDGSVTSSPSQKNGFYIYKRHA
jgi:hypothetical protein